MLEEFELHLENVHVKYDGIVSKDREIKEKENNIEDFIAS